MEGKMVNLWFGPSQRAADKIKQFSPHKMSSLKASWLVWRQKVLGRKTSDKKPICHPERRDRRRAGEGFYRDLDFFYDVPNHTLIPTITSPRYLLSFQFMCLFNYTLCVTELYTYLHYIYRTVQCSAVYYDDQFDVFDGLASRNH